MSYSFTSFADEPLLRELSAQVAKERGVTAVVLALIAEVDQRKLYVPAGYPSMYMYCVHELHLSEQAAYKRICVARKARRFPAIFDAVADGRLSVSAVFVLAPSLMEETADELLAEAAYKTKAQIEQLLAQRFPKPDVPTSVQPVSVLAANFTAQAVPEHSPGKVQSFTQVSTEETGQLSPERVELSVRPADQSTEQLTPGHAESLAQFVPESSCQLSPGIVAQPAALPVEAPAPRARITPIAPQRFAVQVTIRQETHDLLRQAQDLLGHEIASGDVAEVLHRALASYVSKLQKRKFAATEAPRPRRRSRSRRNPRHIPAEVKRTVWERDGGQCTFVSESGRRCPARSSLEFDHSLEVARGGSATVGGIQLRCRVHNQYTAERTFGVEFMRNKREESQVEARHRAVTNRAP